MKDDSVPFLFLVHLHARNEPSVDLISDDDDNALDSLEGEGLPSLLGRLFHPFFQPCPLPDLVLRECLKSLKDFVFVWRRWEIIWDHT